MTETETGCFAYSSIRRFACKLEINFAPTSNIFAHKSYHFQMEVTLDEILDRAEASTLQEFQFYL